MENTDRRTFIKQSLFACAGLFAAGCATNVKSASDGGIDNTLKYGATHKFKTKFCPRLFMCFNSTAGRTAFERMQFFRDAGFTAIEGAVWVDHNGKDFTDAQKQQQREIGKKARELGLEMGNVSSMNEKDFAMMGEFQLPVKGKYVASKEGLREELTRRMDKTFGVLERIGSKTFIIGAGTRGERLPFAKQLDNVIENMAFCAKYCADHGYVMEIEPLNTTSHPNIFIENATLGAEIVKTVNMPSCRLLLDFFHEQMQTGSLDSLDNETVWNSIESFHIADAPSRNEPGTGVIDYAAVLKEIWDKGFRGLVGLEHGQTLKTPEGDMKLLQIYRDLDKVIS